MKKFLKSFIVALKGIFIASKGRNFKVQLIATICTVAVALWLKFSFIEFLLSILLINNVLSAETFNTSIEDLSNQQKELGLSYERAGTARDLAAGAVLLNAITALIVGLAIVLPKIGLLIR